MYDDVALRRVDVDVADTLAAALANSQAGPGVVYAYAQQTGKHFDLRIEVENNSKADYYGYTDIVYTGTSTSFLFDGKKFDVVKATSGLSLRIVLNVGHATDGGQRLSTLVHEIGVHGTQLFGAMLMFGKSWDTIKDKATLEEVLVTQLEQGSYSADHHHTQFGKGGAEDYNELKKQALASMKAWGANPAWQFVGLFGANKWAALESGFVAATKRGEELHEKIYWHPIVEWQDLLKRVGELEKASKEFFAKNKPVRGGLLSQLSSLFG